MTDIYLDSASTTPLAPAVLEAMNSVWGSGLANPASQHRAGQRAQSVVDDASRVLRRSLDVRPASRLIFVSGGTEANNLAIWGWAASPAAMLAAKSPGVPPNIVISAVEHPSVGDAAQSLQRFGFEVRRVPVSPSGIVAPADVASRVDEHTVLVSVMLVNNETGVRQPVFEIAAHCAQRNTPFHCDAVQAIGKIPFSFAELQRAGVGSVTITPHKYHGPRGIGMLVLADGGTEFHPLMFGGMQQLGTRPGTLDPGLVHGLAVATELAVEDLDSHRRQVAALRDGFESRLRAEFGDDMVIHGEGADRAPHCSCLSFLGPGPDDWVDRQRLLLALDAAGVFMSTGSACASGSSEPSHVIRAMTKEKRLLESGVRFSFSRDTGANEVDLAVERITNAVNKLRQQKSPRK